MGASNRDSIGISVEAIRKGAKFTQADIASRVHMSAATISRIENGEAPATLDEIRAILDAINTTEAREFKTFLSDEWTHLERPSFHHPDREHLWSAGWSSSLEPTCTCIKTLPIFCLVGFTHGPQQSESRWAHRCQPGVGKSYSQYGWFSGSISTG